MREIKFRAWNKEKNIMVYDNEDNSSGYWDGCYNSDVGMVNTILNSKYNEKYEFMEYTGLKDKNGVEIYEGDILLRKLYSKPDGKLFYIALYHIIFENGCFKYKGVYEHWLDEKGIKYKERNISNHKFCLGNNIAIETRQIEVIGNIYENKELLEEE